MARINVLMFNANPFITENPFISGGNTTHRVGMKTYNYLQIRLYFCLTGRKDIKGKLLKVYVHCKQHIRKEHRKERIEVVLLNPVIIQRHISYTLIIIQDNNSIL